MALSFHALFPWDNIEMDHNFTLIYNTAKNIYTVTYQGTDAEPKASESFDIFFKNEKDAYAFCQRVAAEREKKTALEKSIVISIPDAVKPTIDPPVDTLPEPAQGGTNK